MPQEAGPGADHAWRVALARAANATMALAMEVGSVTAGRRTLAELLELLPERALIAMLEGPGEGIGMLALSPAVLAGMIEVQTMGRVAAGPVLARRATRTDAAMMAGFIDAALEMLESALAQDADLVWAGGFRYASHLDDPRPLGLLLEDVGYRVLEADLSLAQGVRQGPVLLALPAEGCGHPPAQVAGPAPDAAAVAFGQALAAQVMAAQAELAAVLHRITIPLSAVMGLRPGDVLPLPLAALDRIVIEGLDGVGVCEGKLGQNRGMRAVRLHPARSAAPPPEPEALPALRLAASG